MFDRQDLHAPRAFPAGLAQRCDHARQVERSVAAIPAPVDRVFVQCPDDLRVSIIELDSDDAVQGNGGELRDGGMSTLDMLGVDDDTRVGGRGILHEL